MEDDRRHREKGQKDLSHSTGLNERYSTRQRKGRTSVVSFFIHPAQSPHLLSSSRRRRRLFSSRVIREIRRETVPRGGVSSCIIHS